MRNLLRNYLSYEMNFAEIEEYYSYNLAMIILSNNITACYYGRYVYLENLAWFLLENE